MYFVSTWSQLFVISHLELCVTTPPHLAWREASYNTNLKGRLPICFICSFSFSRSGILESRFTVFTGELWQFFVSLISFADLLWLLLFEEAFIKVMKLLVSILSSSGRRPSILDSIREVLFDRLMVDLQKIRPVVRYMLCFNTPICLFFTLTRINPKNQQLNKKMT